MKGKLSLFGLQTLVAEAVAHLIDLLPQLRVAFQKVDQVRGGNAQGLRSVADLALHRLEDVQGGAGRRPETRVLAADVEPASPILDGVDRVSIHGGVRTFANLKEEG